MIFTAEHLETMGRAAARDRAAREAAELEARAHGAANVSSASAMRDQARELRREAPPAQLVPMNQQLDADGRLHEIDGRHERARLFEPAPEQIPGQLGLELEGGGS